MVDSAIDATLPDVGPVQGYPVQGYVVDMAAATRPSGQFARFGSGRGGRGLRLPLLELLASLG